MTLLNRFLGSSFVKLIDYLSRINIEMRISPLSSRTDKNTDTCTKAEKDTKRVDLRFYPSFILLLKPPSWRPGWWPGALMSLSGTDTGLAESDTYPSGLWSFGCQWPLAGCRSLQCTAAGDSSGMVEQIWSHSCFYLHRRKEISICTHYP